jgi:hypothetical protein
LERNVQQNSGKCGDLIDRVHRVEKAKAVGEPEEIALADTAKQDSPTAKETTPAAEAAVPSNLTDDHVSMHHMKQALDQHKDDVRNWLDVLHSTFVNSLQTKADVYQMHAIMAQLQQIAGADTMSTENFAALAKRALLGRCASCDANINCNTATIKSPIPLPKTAKASNQPSAPPGAMQIRPPGFGQAAMNPAGLSGSTAPGKLPKIPDARTAKNFPTGKIFKNSSSPELRQIRTLTGDEMN